MTDQDSSKPDSPSTLRRRAFVHAASGAAAAAFIPTDAEAATTRKVRRQIMAEVRRQLEATHKLRKSEIKTVVKRVRDLLPGLGDIAHGHVVFGVRVEDGVVQGLSGCEDGHACSGRFDEAPPDPNCSEQGTICNVEACTVQECDAHWCATNACDTETCDNNLCEEQGCDTEACSGHECEANTDTGVVVMMSKTSGWKRVQAELARLKESKQLRVTVEVQDSNDPAGGR